MTGEFKSLKIRLAEKGDTPGMLRIYTPIVENTHTSFEYKVPTESEFWDRVSTYMRKWPWLVCSDGSELLGYAYAVQLRGRVAYSWSVELSVYVHPDYFQKGIGKKLYTVLINLLKIQGARNFYAGIALPNQTSEEFHSKLGFKKIGVFEKVGFKKNWIDLGWYLLQENDSTNPEKFLTMSELTKHPDFQNTLENF